jgi:hypothetical protein
MTAAGFAPKTIHPEMQCGVCMFQMNPEVPPLLPNRSRSCFSSDRYYRIFNCVDRIYRLAAHRFHCAARSIAAFKRSGVLA